MIKLTLTEKGGEPKVLTFDKDEITIGRVTGNDIVLAKGNISKRHTRLTKREGGMEIADLKSTNGTYVNGRKIAGPTVDDIPALRFGSRTLGRRRGRLEESGRRLPDICPDRRAVPATGPGSAAGARLEVGVDYLSCSRIFLASSICDASAPGMPTNFCRSALASGNLPTASSHRAR